MRKARLRSGPYVSLSPAGHPPADPDGNLGRSEPIRYDGAASLPHPALPY